MRCSLLVVAHEAMVEAYNGDTLMREFSGLRGPASVRAGNSSPSYAVSAPRAEGPVTTLVLKEFSACWAPWVACDSRYSGLDVIFRGVLLFVDVDGLLCLIRVDLLRYTIGFCVILPLNSPPLRSLLITKFGVTAAVVLPLIRRPYEGVELNYLCPPKDGLGFTHTSSSYVPPT